MSLTGGGGRRFLEEDATAMTSGSWPGAEHMFDKVVTPSDVGKLNRLVIPKQHAERHFPLGPDGPRAGLLLRFDDRDGRAWRFRYSYWHSSQSYVITKGWSRFVREKALAPGDLVSFHRGPATDRLFIDFRRRIRMWDPLTFPPPRLPPPLYCGSSYPYILNPNCGRRVDHDDGVVPGNSTAKRLRLFGVTVDCSIPEPEASSSAELSFPFEEGELPCLPSSTSQVLD